MQVELEKTGSYTRKISITIPASEVDKAFDSVYREFAKGVQIPGFRPGKAPRGVIEGRFGPRMQSEVQNRLVGDTLFRALSDKEVVPVATPTINAKEPEKKHDFSYSAEFDVQPEIELAKYKDLGVEFEASEVTDEMVNNELEALQKQAVQLVPVLDRDTVGEQDVVLVDYEGTMGGVPFDGGKAENTLIDLEADGYIPGFAEGLLGAKVPGSLKVPVTFPEEYGAKHLAGKDATFHFTLKELKKKDLPKLDDDFAQDMGEESLAALTQKIRDQLDKRLGNEVKDKNRQKLLDALVEANPFELPPSMVEAQAERIISNAAQRMEAMLGKKFQLSGNEFASLRDDTRQTAEQQVRSGLLLMKVSEVEKIEVSDDEVQAEIDKMAEESGEQGPRVRMMFNDPEQRNRLRYRLLDDKTVAFLMEASGAPVEGKAKASTAKAKKRPAKKQEAKEAAAGESAAAPKKKAKSSKQEAGEKTPAKKAKSSKKAPAKKTKAKE